jgi:hypothetical protein
VAVSVWLALQQSAGTTPNSSETARRIILKTTSQRSQRLSQGSGVIAPPWQALLPSPGSWCNAGDRQTRSTGPQRQFHLQPYGERSGIYSSRFSPSKSPYYPHFGSRRRTRSSDDIFPHKGRSSRCEGSRYKVGRLGNPTSQIGTRAYQGAQESVAVRKAKAAKRSADLLPMPRDIPSSGGYSLRQIAAVLNSRGIPAARGGAWAAVQGRRVLAA